MWNNIHGAKIETDGSIKQQVLDFIYLENMILELKKKRYWYEVRKIQ